MIQGACLYHLLSALQSFICLPSDLYLFSIIHCVAVIYVIITYVLAHISWFRTCLLSKDLVARLPWLHPSCSISLIMPLLFFIPQVLQQSDWCYSPLMTWIVCCHNGLLLYPQAWPPEVPHVLAHTWAYNATLCSNEGPAMAPPWAMRTRPPFIYPHQWPNLQMAAALHRPLLWSWGISSAGPVDYIGACDQVFILLVWKHKGTPRLPHLLCSHCSESSHSLLTCTIVVTCWFVSHLGEPISGVLSQWTWVIALFTC